MGGWRFGCAVWLKSPTLWLPTLRSDVVCFESRGPAATGGQHRSLVPVGGSGYHLPPGARLRLVSVQQRFKAYGTSARQLVEGALSPVSQPGSPASSGWVDGWAAGRGAALRTLEERPGRAQIVLGAVLPPSAHANA